MALKVIGTVKRATSKLKTALKRVARLLFCSHSSIDNPSDVNAGVVLHHEKPSNSNKLVERLNEIVTSRKSRVARILRRRRNISLGILRSDPFLPPELLENIASFLTQHDLLKFSRASRDAYMAAEQHLYRRPNTRRFDKLLRTLERSPYKADFILELAFGFETDFYSVKYTVYLTTTNILGSRVMTASRYTVLFSVVPEIFND